MPLTEAVRRVLIVDDSSIMRAMLDGILYGDPGFLVVGLARSAEEAIELVETARPHIVLTDLCMPQLDGFALLGMLEDYRELAKVVLSTRVNLPDETRRRLMARGASAIFDKQEIAQDPKGFLTALRRLRRNPSTPGPAAPERGNLIGAVPFPVPTDEVARARAVRALKVANLDADPRLNILVRHLARLSDYPVAAITIVGSDQLWVKAAVGVAPAVVPRGESICAHAICADGMTVVPDLSADPLFSALPGVTDGLRVRSYVGAPIVSSKGVRLGIVCIADTRPRCPTQDEITIVADVAALVASTLQTPIAPLRSAA